VCSSRAQGEERECRYPLDSEKALDEAVIELLMRIARIGHGIYGERRRSGVMSGAGASGGILW
jgi:hypothetical protein